MLVTQNFKNCQTFKCIIRIHRENRRHNIGKSVFRMVYLSLTFFVRNENNQINSISNYIKLILSWQLRLGDD